MKQRDKKQEIMNAVEHLFRNRRFHEVTLDEVAKEAQVGKGTIYRFFSDNDVHEAIETPIPCIIDEIENGHPVRLPCLGLFVILWQRCASVRRWANDEVVE
ncbi:MAG: TetR/AcrR family transcriptional regulator [Deltaproteobacteria bacterium]|nr:TetR/AcrR family transcriptional regulator [Deltaproteobacteria bacterium]